MKDLNFDDIVYSGFQEIQKKVTDSTALHIFEKVFISPIVELRLSDLLRNGARLSKKNFGEAFDHANEFADRVGIETPQIYIINDKTTNAYTIGHKGKSFIVLHSGLVDALSNDEIKAVVGHEIGHVACSHSMTTFITDFGLLTGSYFTWPVALASEALLKKWVRTLEITADRFAVISSESVDVAESALARLLFGVSKRLDFNIDELLAQNEEIRSSWFYWIKEKCDNTFLTHPSLLKRIVAARLFGRYWFDRQLTKADIDKKVSAILASDLAHTLVTHDDSYETILIHALAYLSKYSGGVSKAERKKILAAAKEYRISQSLMDKLDSLLQNPMVNIASVPEGDLSFLQKEDLLLRLFEVATCDSEYDELEDEAIVLLAERFNIPGELVDAGRLDAAQRKGSRGLLQKWMTAGKQANSQLKPIG